MDDGGEPSVRSIRNFIHVRWRAAQLLRAEKAGDEQQAEALRWAMGVEQLDPDDVRDERAMLEHEFRYRPLDRLTQECSRLWQHLRSICVRCGKRCRWTDNDGVCVWCVQAEEPE